MADPNIPFSAYGTSMSSQFADAYGAHDSSTGYGTGYSLPLYGASYSTDCASPLTFAWTSTEGLLQPTRPTISRV
jgi:hypothetical protein